MDQGGFRPIVEGNGQLGMRPVPASRAIDPTQNHAPRGDKTQVLSRGNSCISGSLRINP